MRAGHALWMHGKFCLKSNGVLEIGPPKLWHLEIVCFYWTFKTHRTDFASEKGLARPTDRSAVSRSEHKLQNNLTFENDLTKPTRWRWNRSCFDYVTATVAEWLRRLTRNQIPFGSAGSNPAGCEYVLQCGSGFFSLSLSLFFPGACRWWKLPRFDNLHRAVSSYLKGWGLRIVCLADQA